MTTPKERMLSLPPDIKACTASVTCTIGTVAGVGVPALIIILGALHAVGVRAPNLPILSEFISQETIDAVAAEEAAETKSKPVSASALGPASDADFPNESSPLLAGSKNQRPRIWRQIVLTVIPILEIVGWAVHLVRHATSNESGLFTVITAFVVLVSWVYSVLRPNLRPSCTPYYDLLLLYFSQFLAACVAIYEGSIHGSASGDLRLGYIARVPDLLLTLGGIIAIINMPLQVRGEPKVDAEGRSPALEDHCTLLQWMTFSWVSPLIALGARQPLEEEDLWQLSWSMRTRVLMRQFSELKRPSLLRRLLAANARDMFLDLGLTVVSALLDFGPPVFLNLILRAMAAEPTAESTSYPTSKLDELRFYASVSIDTLLYRTSDNTTTNAGRPLQRSDAYFFAIGAALCQLIKSQTDLQRLYFSRRASVRIKGELVASIYEKALKRKDTTGAVEKRDKKGKGKAKDGPPQELSSADVGKIVSLIAADAEWISRFITLGSFIYDAPVSAIVSCFLLYSLMGWTAFVGYAAVLLTLPTSNFLIQRTATYQRSVNTSRDKRMQAMNEAIQSIKFIKFSAWESRWIQRVLDARHTELKWLTKLKVTNFFMSMLWDLVPVLVAAIGFSCFTLVAGRELTVDIAFPCLRIFHILTTSLSILPLSIASTIRTLVSIQRIDKYLSEDEVPDHVSSLKRPAPAPHAPVKSRLGCNDATFRWHAGSTPDPAPIKPAPVKESLWARVLVFLRLRKRAPVPEVEEQTSGDEDRPFELRDVSLVFPEGELSVIYGPTGSGKSSLLAALLGEMDQLKGELYLPKDPTHLNGTTFLPLSISYCAQQPWLEHKSIKENILFGSPLDEERYNATLNACALKPDLALFEDGDKTEIGEKGVSLSGGQKARVALARAVYARTHFVLLDDVLSAVDSHTAEHIVQRCLRGPLLKNRTLVLVTHHVDLVLPAAGWFVKMNEGRIDSQGTVDLLRESGLLSMASETNHEQAEEETIDDSHAITEVKGENKTAKKLVEEESKATGNVKLQVYKTYLSAASYWLFGLLVLFLALDQIVQLLQKFWIKHWGESYETEVRMGVTRGWMDLSFPPANRNVVPYLLVYLGIQTLISIINIVSQIPNIWSTLCASRTLYEKMLRSVMRSPTRFFDKTPSGRILNRFSKDVDTIDSGIQTFMVDVLTQVLTLVVSVATIVYVVPYFILPAIVIAYLHLWFSDGYVTASRDLRRIESTTRSPVVSSFSELLTGIVTVRAFGGEKAFLRNMYNRLDLTQTATHYYWMCNRWLLVRFDMLGAISVLIATIGSINGGASAGLAGIVITQAQEYVRSLYWGLRFWTELEQSLNSVERIQEYLDLPSEPPAVIESNRPPATWPSATTGSLIVEDLVINYAADLEPVLNGVSFTINPSEKIGIVGRTGSGKSTLALALFRFVDPAAGRIILDGLDITMIGLDDLRSRLTLIPQDAVLFKGTVRENLDPFNEYTDAECIEALQRVHLPTTTTPEESPMASRTGAIRDAIDNTLVPNTESGVAETGKATGNDGFTTTTAVDPTSAMIGGAGSGLTIFTLDTSVSEGGNNFSQGQRQLLSMARALLRKSSVIVMDESTASVDFETDAKIQTTIREEFGHSILITIAHRLRTVIDNDRILVLDAGKVVEFDTPRNLLNRPGGVFHEMCERSGDYEHLLRLA